MSKPTITYYYDSLCGWCYGFKNVMKQIQEKYNDKVNFEVISGGLFIGERVGFINDIAPYIKGAYQTVEDRTEVLFGEGFLKKGLEENSMYLNSLPPSIALSIIKEDYPEKAMQYAALLLDGFYKDGNSASDMNIYNDYLAKVDIKDDNFLNKLADEKYIQLTINDIQTAHEKSVNGFPSLVLTQNDTSITLANGYVDFEELDTKIEELLTITSS